jgi:phosphoribosyl 1,2-cyclic phosphodiesterase/DNA-binding SARP family transcriptional activator
MTTAELREILRQVVTRSKGIHLDDPVAIERYIERLPASLNSVVGGNTSCVEVRTGGRVFIFDLGSGARLLGKELLAQGLYDYHIFFSHTHYDHIEGFPFFAPAFHPKATLHFHSPFPDLEDRLRALLQPAFFPVDLDYMQARRIFHIFPPQSLYEVGPVKVEAFPLNHPGGCFAYKLIHAGKTFIYASDGEYPNMEAEATAEIEQFFQDADMLIFDAMYTYADSITNKSDWGHSTPKIGAELAWRAGVKKLVLTHHDPLDGASALAQKVDDADQHLRYRAARQGSNSRPPVEIILAEEGLTLNIEDSVFKTKPKKPTIRIQTLGDFQVWRNGELISDFGSPIAEKLLKILVARRGESLTEAELADLLFHDEASLYHPALHAVLNTVRYILEPDLPPGEPSSFVVAKGQGFALRQTQNIKVDFEDLERLLNEGKNYQAEGRDDLALLSYEQAVSLHQGDFMPEDRSGDWSVQVRNQVQTQYARILNRLADLYAKRGDFEQAIRLAQSGVDEDAYHEAGYRRLMRYHHCKGDSKTALTIYSTLEKLKREFFQEEPSPETQTLRDAIQRGEPVSCVEQSA